MKQNQRRSRTGLGDMQADPVDVDITMLNGQCRRETGELWCYTHQRPAIA
jgi:hypothetical protein